MSDLIQLAPGEYCLTVFDQNDCTFNTCVEVPEGECGEGEVTIEINNTTCFETSDGSASLSNFDSERTYEILWSTDETTSSIQDLAAGTYEVIITDDLACSQMITFEVSSPDELVLEIESTNETILGLSLIHI